MKKDENVDIKHGIDSNEGGILAYLLRLYIKDMGYANHLNVLVERAVEKDNKAKAESNSAAVTTISKKGQYMANLNAGSITWKVFLNLLSRVFGVKKFRLTIEVQHADDTVTDHFVVVDMTKITTKYDNQLKKDEVEGEKPTEETTTEDKEVKDGNKRTK